jgi:hypothetical protein
MQECKDINQWCEWYLAIYKKNCPVYFIFIYYNNRRVSRMKMAMLLLHGKGTRVCKREWSKERSKELWNDVLGGMYGTSWWRDNMRMSKETFLILCQELRPHLERKITKFRDPVSVEAWLAGRERIWSAEEKVAMSSEKAGFQFKSYA